MSEHASTGPSEPHAPHAGHDTNYVQVWMVLCGLLVVSVAGPFLGIKVVTMITAFGIAIVKAYLVATKFMHLNIEKKFVMYMLGAMVTLMLLMFGGISPDVLKHDGARWNNDAAKAATVRGLKEKPSHHGGGEEPHGEKAAHEAEEH